MYGKIIKKLRKEKKLTQEDLAKLINFKSGSAIGMIEREERELNLEALNKLSEIFNVSIDYILGKTSEKFPGEIEETTKDLQTLIKSKLEKLPKDKKEKAIKDMMKILNDADK
ncbi:helix-turn-helix domain-containing protein [Clostridium pasteurianum]|uniref:Putative transcriptional regulator n=1 Tax=Clostridium pasteurianum BC1 TaxID=86416 RepID=R4K796_CLOPA|nr:helix-turn-helix transcriptional regulator [Clostridium pasteurianum]AGK99037.1 putative transcriptional regulator [Clostridium pasteurianum BC1]